MSNESAKVSSTQSNDNATKENAKQVTTFNSVAKPRMMYATANRATSSLPKYQPQVKSSINDYIRKRTLKHHKSKKIIHHTSLNMAIEMV